MIINTPELKTVSLIPREIRKMFVLKQREVLNGKSKFIC